VKLGCRSRVRLGKRASVDDRLHQFRMNTKPRFPRRFGLANSVLFLNLRPSFTPQSTSGPERKKTHPFATVLAKARQPTRSATRKTPQPHSRKVASARRSFARKCRSRSRSRLQPLVTGSVPTSAKRPIPCPGPLELPQSRCRASPADSLLRLDPLVGTVTWRSSPPAGMAM
jgi:hypothetical protein